ncbi:MAG: ACT domain-containing protein, partial [Woeseia sp.]
MVNNIEDRADNATRFLVVGRRLLAASGEDKTTILVSTSDTTGAGVLHNLLQPLAKHSINITRIESRPSRRKNWDYVFFLDLDGHAAEAPLAEALAELEGISSLYRVLGAYPRAIRQ